MAWTNVMRRIAGASARLGSGDMMLLLGRLIEPFSGASLLVTAGNSVQESQLLGDFFRVARTQALLFDATEGEAFANPLCRPELWHFRDGDEALLFRAEAVPLKGLATLPHSTDPSSTADWIERVLAGEAPLPLPLANEIAFCLYGADYTIDMNQAKPIAAIDAGNVVAA